MRLLNTATDYSIFILLLVKKYKKVVMYTDQDRGTIETPIALQRNEEINYIIVVDSDSKILLTFAHSIAKLNCNDPTFVIYLDVNNNSDVVHLCSQETPWPIMSHANFIRIRYRVGSILEFVHLDAAFQKISGISFNWPQYLDGNS